jgi:anti-anti-sigma regulatory factor
VRITIHEPEGAVILTIDGRVADPFLIEFQRAWHELAPSLGSRKLSVDLRGVTFMDMSGRQLLAEIHAKTGADFIADRPLTKYYAEEAIQGIRTNLESGK